MNPVLPNKNVLRGQRSRVEYRSSCDFFAPLVLRNHESMDTLQGGSMWAYLKAENWCNCVVISLF